eukprot:scaffold19146_cov85-Isochrysis_galbana.AAC.4
MRGLVETLQRANKRVAGAQEVQGGVEVAGVAEHLQPRRRGPAVVPAQAAAGSRSAPLFPRAKDRCGHVRVGRRQVERPPRGLPVPPRPRALTAAP